MLGAPCGAGGRGASPRWRGVLRPHDAASLSGLLPSKRGCSPTKKRRGLGLPPKAHCCPASRQPQGWGGQEEPLPRGHWEMYGGDRSSPNCMAGIRMSELSEVSVRTDQGGGVQTGSGRQGGLGWAEGTREGFAEANRYRTGCRPPRGGSRRGQHTSLFLLKALNFQSIETKPVFLSPCRGSVRSRDEKDHRDFRPSTRNSLAGMF